MATGRTRSCVDYHHEREAAARVKVAEAMTRRKSGAICMQLSLLVATLPDMQNNIAPTRRQYIIANLFSIITAIIYILYLCAFCHMQIESAYLKRQYIFACSDMLF